MFAQCIPYPSYQQHGPKMEKRLHWEGIKSWSFVSIIFSSSYVKMCGWEICQIFGVVRRWQCFWHHSVTTGIWLAYICRRRDVWRCVDQWLACPTRVSPFCKKLKIGKDISLRFWIGWNGFQKSQKLENVFILKGASSHFYVYKANGFQKVPLVSEFWTNFFAILNFPIIWFSGFISNVSLIF